ncbi:MAG: hypothetical protein ACPGES_00810 [Coraliomargarita sp.]
MKRFHLFSSVGIMTLCLGLLGCATSENNGRSEFTKTINFSKLDSFSYRNTLISGMEWRESEEVFLEEWSKQVMEQEMVQRGFELVDADADFYAVVKWRKNVSSYVNTFDPIDGPGATINRRNTGPTSFAARVSMTIEIYNAETGEMFWRKDQPNLFEAIQFTQDRVRKSLQRGIKHFPERVFKDPNLPSIE